MTGYNKIFIDTAPFIYFIEKNEKNPEYFEKVKIFFQNCHENNIKLVTSVITLEEYMVYPFRCNCLVYISAFEKLLQALEFEVLDINYVIAQNAAKIRASYKSFKAMDALQLSAAHFSGSELFITNDKQLRQYKTVECKTIDDLPVV
jgi:predicted nucleic acid-binding protein